MKRIIFNSLLLFVAAALGLATGFALRGKRVRNPGVESPVKVVSSAGWQRKTLPHSQPRGHVRINDDSPLATQLERDLSMSTGVTRWLYWLDAMEKASASDFPRLFRLAEGNAAASRLVSQRWIDLYPRHLFDTIVAAARSGSALTRGMMDLSHSLFTDWPKRDPEAAIAALSAPEDFAMRSSWRDDVAATVIRNDAERGLRLFNEWHIESFGPFMNGVEKWAAADPRHAAEFALAHPAGYATELTMETIGKEWARTDPARALEFAVSKPDEFGSTLAAAALKEWSGRNLNEAADWLARADAHTRNRLSPSFVETWAKQEANGALAWCESNLSGSSLAQAVGGVMKGAAEKDVAAAAALVTSLNPSAARTEAAVAVGQKWFPDRLGEDKPASPAAIAWLSALDTESATRLVDEIQWRWATCDPKGMAGFLASSPERFSANPYNIVARELARKNPTEALEWADRLPTDRALSAGADAFAEWRRSQPDAAMKWLGELSSADPRRIPYLQGAIRNIAWDVQGAEQLAAMNPPERDIAREVIKDMKLPEDQQKKLLEVLGRH
jgi:hypothetical protein